MTDLVREGPAREVIKQPRLGEQAAQQLAAGEADVADDAEADPARRELFERGTDVRRELERRVPTRGEEGLRNRLAPVRGWKCSPVDQELS
jgi:hypothetical protein